MIRQNLSLILAWAANVVLALALADFVYIVVVTLAENAQAINANAAEIHSNAQAIQANGVRIEELTKHVREEKP